MANSTVQFGFEPARRLDGAALNFLVNQGQIAYNNAHTFGEGDVITLLSTGYIDAATTTSNPVLGVFTSCSYANALNTIQPSNVRFWNAPTLATTIAVTTQYWDDPQVVFRVRASGLVPQSSIGLNANFLSNASPNTLTGISQAAIDVTTISTLSTLPFRIIGFAADVNNQTTLANPVLEVVLNTSVYKTQTGV